MSATLIVTADPAPEGAAAMSSYTFAVHELFAVAGGKVIRRGQIGQTLAGRFPALFLLMEFPTRRAILEVFDSDAYQAILAARERAFSHVNIAILDVDA